MISHYDCEVGIFWYLSPSPNSSPPVEAGLIRYKLHVPRLSEARRHISVTTLPQNSDKDCVDCLTLSQAEHSQHVGVFHGPPWAILAPSCDDSGVITCSFRREQRLRVLSAPAGKDGAFASRTSCRRLTQLVCVTGLYSTTLEDSSSPSLCDDQ